MIDIFGAPTKMLVHEMQIEIIVEDKEERRADRG